MELHLSTPEAVFLAHELADLTGQPEEELKAALFKIIQPAPAPQEDFSVEEVMKIARRCAALPDYDTRSADEILGYDELGLPT